MRLVYKFYIGENNELLNLCKTSKDLYNQALYTIKHELKDNNKWLSYSEVNRIMQTTKNLNNEINYRKLKAQVSQQCLRVLDKNITSYVHSVKDFSKNKGKYKAMPRFPKYKEKVNSLVYTNQCCRIKDGYLVLSKTLKIRIPQYEKYCNYLKRFQQVQIIPKLDGSFNVNIIYERECENHLLDSGKYASIDLGIDNFATMIDSNGDALLYNGRVLKSINQFFNKNVSKLKSKLDKNRRTSRRIRSLYKNREFCTNDIYHKMSRHIVNRLIESGTGTLVVGYNKGWKDSICIGHRNNQTFVSLSHDTFIHNLQYKCELCGIKFILNEESYTSKCDGLSLEKICKHDEYLGKRIKRGLYQSSSGRLINADVNGALNIMRKVIGDSNQIDSIIDSGRLFRPITVNINCYK